MRDEREGRPEPLSYASRNSRRDLSEWEAAQLATNCLQGGVVALACCVGLLCTDGTVATVAELLVGLFVAAAIILGVDALRRSGRVSTSVVLGLLFASLAAALVVLRISV